MAGENGANLDKNKHRMYDMNSICNKLNSIFGNQNEETKMGEWSKLFNVS